MCYMFMVLKNLELMLELVYMINQSLLLLISLEMKVLMF